MIFNISNTKFKVIGGLYSVVLFILLAVLLYYFLIYGFFTRLGDLVRPAKAIATIAASFATVFFPFARYLGAKTMAGQRRLLVACVRNSARGSALFGVAIISDEIGPISEFAVDCD